MISSRESAMLELSENYNVPTCALQFREWSDSSGSYLQTYLRTLPERDLRRLGIQHGQFKMVFEVELDTNWIEKAKVGFRSMGEQLRTVELERVGCGEDGFETTVLKTNDGAMRFVRCSDCGLLYQAPDIESSGLGPGTQLLLAVVNLQKEHDTCTPQKDVKFNAVDVLTPEGSLIPRIDRKI